MEQTAHEHYRYMVRLVESEARRVVQMEETTGRSISHDDPSDSFWYHYALVYSGNCCPSSTPSLRSLDDLYGQHITQFRLDLAAKYGKRKYADIEFEDSKIPPRRPISCS